MPAPQEFGDLTLYLIRAEKRAVEAQKNKKQKAEKEAKLEVLKRSNPHSAP